VFVTGHTGFKGSWLCEWLLNLGADVWGYSLPPPTSPSLFAQLGLSRRVHHTVGDVRNIKTLSRALNAARPHFVFHLAAQPIVLEAHANPGETWSTNVMGTVNLLEGLRGLRSPCATVVVTTDKVYGPEPKSHREEHALGASEPYGASKAAVELAVQAWREAFGMDQVATARAGNVIGGGDWAPHRLVPDCARALLQGKTISVRNPSAVRPWQHVLDPLHGYLLLASYLASAPSEVSARAFNFGPSARDHRTVRELVREILSQWPGKWSKGGKPGSPRESAVLRLDATLARRVLKWKPTWHFEESVARTVEWYRSAVDPRSIRGITHGQIAAFSADL